MPNNTFVNRQCRNLVSTDNFTISYISQKLTSALKIHYVNVIVDYHQLDQKLSYVKAVFTTYPLLV